MTLALAQNHAGLRTTPERVDSVLDTAHVRAIIVLVIRTRHRALRLIPPGAHAPHCTAVLRSPVPTAQDQDPSGGGVAASRLEQPPEHRGLLPLPADKLSQQLRM